MWWWREGQVMGTFQGSSQQSKGEDSWKRNQLELARAQIMISENCFLMVILGLVVLGSELALILEYYDKGSRNKCLFILLLSLFGSWDRLSLFYFCFEKSFFLQNIFQNMLCYWQKWLFVEISYFWKILLHVFYAVLFKGLIISMQVLGRSIRNYGHNSFFIFGVHAKSIKWIL